MIIIGCLPPVQSIVYYDDLCQSVKGLVSIDKQTLQQSQFKTSDEGVKTSNESLCRRLSKGKNIFN